MSQAKSAERAAGLRRLAPYTAYKDSGVEWLGEIPAHWEVKRLKFSAYIEAGQSPPSELVADGTEGLPFLQGNADFGPLSPIPQQVCDAAPKKAKRGDILLSVRAPVGAMNIADRVYGIGRGLCATRPTNDLDLRFCFYLLTTTRTQLDAVATGSTYNAVSTSQVGDLPALLSPIPEQRAIAAFLDRETARIDALVAKKERLIELLQEKRTALITRAVTKGLDPNIPMKDSGVDWLGEIPAHWEVLNAGRFINRIEQGWSPVAEDRQAGPDEWAVIKLSAVAKGAFLSSEHKALPLDLAPDTRCEIRDGDFLLTRANTPELVGDVCVVRGARPRLMLCDLVYRLNLRRDRVASEFLAYWFLSPTGRYQIEVEARGSSQSMVKVSQGLIRAWMTILPPIPDQSAIAAFLDREAARIDALVAKVRDVIDRLKEFRAALISAAVTGKIDVREEAA